MKHVITALVENQPGVLARIVGLISGRGYNIESLNVAPTHDPTASRLTMKVQGDDRVLEQVTKQLNKLVDVIKVSDLTQKHYLNRELILAAALLHDITKTRSFQTLEDHAETGAQLLAEIGYPEVGRIVGQHVRLDRYFSSKSPTEEEVVNYADKRVLHDRIVPLSERMGYILEKYGREPERKRAILLLWEKTEALEARLFAGIPFAPDDISRLLAEGPP